jgi:hypothetical protein
LQLTRKVSPLYGDKDLKRVDGLEVASDQHSPIIGWAYDGNPIYGPYGYVKKSGGIITQMKSGYSLDLTMQIDLLFQISLKDFL